MVAITSFEESNRSTSGDNGSKRALTERTDEPKDGYFLFHAEHVKEHKDNLSVNSFCLPVYASVANIAKVQAGTPVDTSGRLTPNVVSSEKQVASKRTKRGARPTRSGMDQFASYNQSPRQLSSISPTQLHFGDGTAVSHVSLEPPTSVLDDDEEFAPLDLVSKLGDSSQQESTSHTNLTSLKKEESKESTSGFVTRSGRITRTKKVSYMVTSDDEEFDDGISPRRKRRRGNGGISSSSGPGYRTLFSEHAGMFKLRDKIHVESSLPIGESPCLSDLISLDASGKVVSVDLDALPNGVVNGLDNLRQGDELISCGDRSVSALKAFRANTCTVAVFGREFERNISKLCGLQGEFIHPSALYEIVSDLGGYENVIRNRQWQTVRVKLGLQRNTTSSGFTLRKAYETYFM